MLRNAFIGIFTFAILLGFSSPVKAAVSAEPQRLSTMEKIRTTDRYAVLRAECSGLPVLDAAVDEGDIPVLVQSGELWALPYGTRQVSVQVEASSYRDISLDELAEIEPELLNGLPELVTSSPVMYMRGIPLTTLAVNPVQPSPEGDGFVFYEDVQFRIDYEAGSSNTIHRPLPRAFYEVMRHSVSNLDEIAGEPDRLPEPYLIITPPGYEGAALNLFAQWKRQRGHEVTIVSTAVTGTTPQLILNYLRTLYETAETPPVFVVLVGDVDGTNPMPGWLVPGYYLSTNISDHPYTQLEGNDYLPEVLIGRFSVDSQSDLQTIVNKTINYEKIPFLPQGAWRSRMAIVGVRSTPTQFLTYNSAWPTMRWVAGQFMNAGYTDIDSIYYPGGQASQINESVNNGLSFLTYRGFGSPSDWTYPQYSINEISGTSNGQMLPVITSIVCGGGAFDNDTDPCFGEAWLRRGTSASPGGAIAFIGPSELDTKTRWNNTITAGFYEGILLEGVNTLGGAMTRGKMELIRQFPSHVNYDEPDPNHSVPFYFKCYNLLGDPGLNHYVGPADAIETEIVNEPRRGSPTVTISVSDAVGSLNDVRGTVSANGSVFSRAVSDENGEITLALPQDQTTTSVDIVLTKPRYQPAIFTQPLAQAQATVAASEMILHDDGLYGSSGNGNGIANPGETLAFVVELTNYGTAQAGAGSLQLASSDERFVVITPSVAIPALNAGATAGNLIFRVDVAANAEGYYPGVLEWNASAVNTQWHSTHVIETPQLAIIEVYTNGSPGNPEPGTTQAVRFLMTNPGAMVMPASTATLSSSDPRIQIFDAAAIYGSIAQGLPVDASDNGFEIAVDEMYPGERIPVRLVFSADGDVVQTVDYELTIGSVSLTDPTAPDGYGYRAFDSGDTDYSEAPAYSWIEIDPNYGGPGLTLPISDVGAGYDMTTTITLPFTFRFYGNAFTQLSVCSNGFAALGQTAESYMRNYRLPAIASPDRMICPFWDDLYTGGGRVCRYYDEASGRFIVEWSNMINSYANHAEESFQIILHDTDCWPTRTNDGDIVFQYRTINNVDASENYATIGIQDRSGGYALPLNYANTSVSGIRTPSSGSAIRITTGRQTVGSYVVFDGSVIDDDSEGVSIGNGNGSAQNGETIEWSLRLANIGTEVLPPTSGTLTEMDPLVELLTSELTFGEAAVGGTTVSNPIAVRLSPMIQDGHCVNFSVSLGEGVIPCAVLPMLVVTGPNLLTATLRIDDDEIDGSHGNNNGEFNPLETVSLIPRIWNFGQNTAVDVTAVLTRDNSNVFVQQNTISLGDVPVGDAFEANGSFLVAVPPGVGDTRQIPLTVTLTDAYGLSWQNSFTYIVAETILQYDKLRISDPAPGGNNNNRANPGETIDLYVQLRNRGTGLASEVEFEITSVTGGASITPSQIETEYVSGNSVRELSTPFTVVIDENVTEPGVIHIDAIVRCEELDPITVQIPLIVGDASFYDNFEVAGNGWGVYGTQGLWNRQSDVYHSASNAYYCGDPHTGMYPPSADAYLRSKPFAFPGHGTLVVSTRYDIADFGDCAQIDLQTGPSTYQMLEQLNGTALEWQELHFSLEGLPTASKARIRFWFRSNGYLQGEGWYLDDVIILDESEQISGEAGAVIPERLSLSQNFPNPFNDQTSLTYALPSRTHVRLTLYSIEGRKVAELVNEVQEAGHYSIGWQPVSLASGLYFVRLNAGGELITRKIAYLK